MILRLWFMFLVLLAMETASAYGQMPTVTNAAPSFSGSTVTLWGGVNPNGLQTSCYWEWGTTTTYGTILGQSSGLNGQTLQTIGAGISGLSPGTTYHYQLVASNSAGVASGGDQSFTTPAVFEQVFTYVISNNTVTVTGFTPTGYSGQAGLLVIPGIIVGLPVVSIGTIAFSGISLTSLTIPDSVTSIGTSAFAYCTGLTSFMIPTSVTNLSPNAFWRCTGLTNVTIPGSVTSLGDHVFADCANLRSATIQSTSIGDYQFSGCSNLAGIAIGNTVTTIGAQAFENCAGLTNLTMPDGVRTIGEFAFSSCSGLAAVHIPNTVTNLARYTFRDCSRLTQVTLPTGLRTVQELTFSGCSGLTNVMIPEGVTELDAPAFQGCISLTTVAIPASVLSIAVPDIPFNTYSSPFDDCTSLSAIDVSPLNSAYSSVEGVLLNKDQSKILLCPLGKRGNYVIPDSVIVVGDSAFANCSNLADVTIAGSVAALEYHAFDRCVSLTNITIPDSVTNIHGAYAGCFGGCVDGGVFGGCTSLTNVVIGKGLTYLGLGAFTGCSNLLSVYFKGDAPALGFTVVGYEDIFGADSTTVYYLPATTGWGSTLAGRPALLWNPQIQISAASFGVRPNSFGFNITGTSDIPIVIEACTNLGAGSRVPLQSCTLTNGLVYFVDPQWTNYPNRIYRIRSP